MADGKPWDQLNQNMQRTILYHHVLQQVSQNLGSTIQDTTQLRMAQFTASLQDARMALGQAFLPILYQVLPILTAFMQGLYKALQYVYAFSKALFGGFKMNPFKQQTKDAEKQQQALQGVGGAATDASKAIGKAGKSAKKAGKEAKGGLAGFDQINLLPEKAADAGGGGGGGGGGGAAGVGAGAPAIGFTPEPPDPTAFTDFADKIAEKFKDMVAPLKKAWEFISSFLQIEFHKILGWWKENGDQIIEAWNNVWSAIKPIVMWIVGFIWDSVKGLIQGVIRFFEGLIEFLAGIFTGDWKKAFSGLLDMVIGAVQAMWNFFNLTLFGGVKKLLFTLLKDGSKIFLDFAAAFKKPILQVITDVIKGITGFIKGFKQFFSDFGAWLQNYAAGVAQKVISVFEGIGGVGKTIWNAITGAFKGAVNWFSRSVVTPIANELDEIKTGFSRGIGEGFKAVLNAAIKGFNKMLGGFNALKNKVPLVKEIPDLKIPLLATGGIATRATLAMVGEGGSPEAITPIDKLQGFITNAVIAAMKFQGGGGEKSTINLNIDGRTFARIVKPYLDQETRRVGGDIRLNKI